MAFVEPEPDAPGGQGDDGDGGGGEEAGAVVFRRILAARDKPRSPWLLVFALALFIVFTVLAFRELPPIENPRWELIIIAGLVCVPGLLAHALEYRGWRTSPTTTRPRSRSCR